ncbi:MAG TPA: hypothetical protein ENJ31_01590 [Anaerolineae bacterium]|nr:hypothetical protein [Anaerolineae bacterium]
MVTLRQIPAFEDGQALGRLAYSALFDNDQALHAWADRRWAVPNAVVRGFIGTETTQALWDGYHLLRSDAKTLHYAISVSSNNPAEPLTVALYYDYGGSGQVKIAEISGTDSASGTYDLSGFAAGLYRVYARMNRTDGNHGGSATCQAPYTTYSGSRTFTTPPTITDGAVGAAATFNIWRGNDLYFGEQISLNAPHLRVSRGYVGNEPSLLIWNGYAIHCPDHERIYYRVSLSSAAGGNVLKGIYDYDALASKHVFATISAAGTVEGYADLPASTYSAGATYRVVWQLSRSDVYTGTGADIQYMFLGPAAANAGFAVPGELVVGQYAYGDTAGEDTRAELLSDNDSNLNGRQGMIRRDYAVRKAEYIDLGSSGGQWHYRLIRQHDLLYYRGSGITLRWGTDESQPLDDVGSDDYKIFDLRQLSGMPPGTIYYLDSSNLEFAAEVG